MIKLTLAENKHKSRDFVAVLRELVFSEGADVLYRMLINCKLNILVIKKILFDSSDILCLLWTWRKYINHKLHNETLINGFVVMPIEAISIVVTIFLHIFLQKN